MLISAFSVLSDGLTAITIGGIPGTQTVPSR
jgi:hypothetical protein